MQKVTFQAMKDGLLECDLPHIRKHGNIKAKQNGNKNGRRPKPTPVYQQCAKVCANLNQSRYLFTTKLRIWHSVPLEAAFLDADMRRRKVWRPGFSSVSSMYVHGMYSDWLHGV